MKPRFYLATPVFSLSPGTSSKMKEAFLPDHSRRPASDRSVGLVGRQPVIRAGERQRIVVIGNHRAEKPGSSGSIGGPATDWEPDGCRCRFPESPFSLAAIGFHWPHDSQCSHDSHAWFPMAAIPHCSRSWREKKVSHGVNETIYLDLYFLFEHLTLIKD